MHLDLSERQTQSRHSSTILSAVFLAKICHIQDKKNHTLGPLHSKRSVAPLLQLIFHLILLPATFVYCLTHPEVTVQFGFCLSSLNKRYYRPSVSRHQNAASVRQPSRGDASLWLQVQCGGFNKLALALKCCCCCCLRISLWRHAVAVSEMRPLSHLPARRCDSHRGASMAVMGSWIQCESFQCTFVFIEKRKNTTTTVTVTYFISQLGIFSHYNILSAGHISYSRGRLALPAHCEQGTTGASNEKQILIFAGVTVEEKYSMAAVRVRHSPFNDTFTLGALRAVLL